MKFLFFEHLISTLFGGPDNKISHWDSVRLSSFYAKSGCLVLRSKGQKWIIFSDVPVNSKKITFRKKILLRPSHISILFIKLRVELFSRINYKCYLIFTEPFLANVDVILCHPDHFKILFTCWLLKKGRKKILHSGGDNKYFDMCK